MMTLTPARSSSAEMRRVASRPSTPGIRMSIRTTSARSAAGQVDRLLAVGGLADDLQVPGGVDEDPEPGADQGLVVGEQDPDRLVSSFYGSGGRRGAGAGQSAMDGQTRRDLVTATQARAGLHGPRRRRRRVRASRPGRARPSRPPPRARIRPWDRARCRSRR